MMMTRSGSGWLMLCFSIGSSSPLITCTQGRSQDFSKEGAEIMEAKAMKRKNCL